MFYGNFCLHLQGREIISTGNTVDIKQKSDTFKGFRLASRRQWAWNGGDGAGKEPLVLEEFWKNLDFQRCAQDVDTGAEKESLVAWEYKGMWRQGNVRNCPELWWESDRNWEKWTRPHHAWLNILPWKWKKKELCPEKFANFVQDHTTSHPGRPNYS